MIYIQAFTGPSRCFLSLFRLDPFRNHFRPSDFRLYHFPCNSARCRTAPPLFMPSLHYSNLHAFFKKDKNLHLQFNRPVRLFCPAACLPACLSLTLRYTTLHYLTLPYTILLQLLPSALTKTKPGKSAGAGIELGHRRDRSNPTHTHTRNTTTTQVARYNHTLAPGRQDNQPGQPRQEQKLDNTVTSCNNFNSQLDKAPRTSTTHEPAPCPLPRQNENTDPHQHQQQLSRHIPTITPHNRRREQQNPALNLFVNLSRPARHNRETLQRLLHARRWPTKNPHQRRFTSRRRSKGKSNSISIWIQGYFSRNRPLQYTWTADYVSYEFTRFGSQFSTNYCKGYS